MTALDARSPTTPERAARVAAVAAEAADDVDRAARFPHEAIDALREERLLWVMAPEELGGEGAGLDVVAAAVRQVGRSCASAAMVYAMHQIQVACLLRHGGPALHRWISDAADRQLLLASATSEVTVGGDVRTSRCAIEPVPDGWALTKQAPVISYGDQADAVLATARRHPDAASSDQVLVVCERATTVLERTGGWDPLGFRGTCSNGYVLRASGTWDAVLPDAYGDISGQTMLPVSHLLWASLWLGIAEEAAGTAHRYVRKAARATPGTVPPGASRVAEIAARLEELRGLRDAALGEYLARMDDRDSLSDLRFAVSMNNLKLAMSTGIVDVASRSLLVCGMAGYKQDSEFSLGRLLRDAYGAQVMVNNDRILANTTQLLLGSREL